MQALSAFQVMYLSEQVSIAVAVQNQQELGLNEVTLSRQKLYEH